MPFELRCRLRYWDERRRWPSRLPTTFSQKVLWRLTFDRRPLLVTLADKVAARAYVEEVVGPEVLSTVHAVVADPDQLEPAQLPDEFVVKPNHASQMVWIVADWAGDGVHVQDKDAVVASGMIVSNRASLDWDRLVRTSRAWLATDYGNLASEWAYTRVPRRLMVEELLPGTDRAPTDYKFFVFDGRVECVVVNADRFGRYSLYWANPDWSPVDPEIDVPVTSPAPPPPPALDRMIEVAGALGRGLDFARVDLYNPGDRIVFGEMTVYPGGLAVSRYHPEWLGRFWTLPDLRPGA